MRPDWTVDQGWDAYTPGEHAVWKALFERQTKLLPGRACDEFVQGMKNLPIGPEQIPDFRALSEALMKKTGWQVVAVPGPVPNDVFGHVPMLMNPAIADFIQAYGEGGLRAQKLGVLDALSRVYFYTVEVGLVKQPDGLRIYGAGIASSYTESVFALDDPSPNRIGFDLERVIRTLIRIDDFQESYFVIDHLDQLLDLARIDFAPVYQRIEGQPDHQPGTVLANDTLVSRGTGRHHTTPGRG